MFGVGYRFSLDVDGADRANLGAFSAGSARARIRPLIVKVHYDLRVFPSQFQIQRVDTLYLIADSYATRAEYAPVPVDDQKIVGGIYLVAGPVAL
jgi:hypothetical protein